MLIPLLSHRRYDLVVIATDQGIPPRSASVEVKVIVEDDNDHAPEFGTSSYTATMYDSSNTGELRWSDTGRERERDGEREGIKREREREREREEGIWP